MYVWTVGNPLGWVVAIHFKCLLVVCFNNKCFTKFNKNITKYHKQNNDLQLGEPNESQANTYFFLINDDWVI